MQELTGPGQINKGASVVLSYDGEAQAHIVDQVLRPGTDREEILLSTKTNLYFITSMAVDKTSWAKQVKFSNPTR